MFAVAYLWFAHEALNPRRVERPQAQCADIDRHHGRRRVRA
jgi:hypothetical protein